MEKFTNGGRGLIVIDSMRSMIAELKEEEQFVINTFRKLINTYSLSLIYTKCGTKSDKDERMELCSLSYVQGKRSIHQGAVHTSILVDCAPIIPATIQAMPVHNLMYFTARPVNNTVFEDPLLVGDRPTNGALQMFHTHIFLHSRISASHTAGRIPSQVLCKNIMVGN